MKLCILIIIVLIAGGLAQVAISTPKQPSEARIEALEARVHTLELWAVKHGGKF